MSACNWSLSHLHRDPALVLSLESFVDRYVLGGILLSALILCLSYPLLHTLYMRGSTMYRQGLTAEQRIVVVQHTIEAAVWALCWIPTTYLVLDFNFCAHDATTAEDELGFHVTISTIFLGMVVLLYCFEINSRSTSLRPILVVHHVGACCVGVASAFVFTEATVITASLLVYFITYEAIVFVGLVLYRLGNRHTARVMLVGMWVFGISRPVQVVLVLASLLANRDHIVVWQGLASAIITLGFTALQVYTLTIHYKIYEKSSRWTDQWQLSPLYGTMLEGRQRSGSDGIVGSDVEAASSGGASPVARW